MRHSVGRPPGIKSADPDAFARGGRVPASPDALESAREADRLAADRARRDLRAHGLVTIEPDERVAVMLEPGEEVVAVRRGAGVDRRQPWTDVTALRGDLYVTTRRLIHLGRLPLAYDLDVVREAIVVGDELLLAIEPDLGVTVSIDDPCVLRVLIAAARGRSSR